MMVMVMVKRFFRTIIFFGTITIQMPGKKEAFMSRYKRFTGFTILRIARQISLGSEDSDLYSSSSA